MIDIPQKASKRLRSPLELPASRHLSTHVQLHKSLKMIQLTEKEWYFKQLGLSV